MAKVEKSKRFKYSLETVLKVRKIREKQEQDKFAEAEKKVALEEQKLKELENEELYAYNQLVELMNSDDFPGVNIIQMHKENLKILKGKITEQEEAVENAKKERDDQREKLTQAVKERKIMERDKEKTREKWKKLMDKEEAKFMDEIASIKFATKKE